MLRELSYAAFVLHIPHASIEVPDEVRPSLLLDDATLATELLRMTDRYTDDLFALDHPAISVVRFPVSRIVVDPERFEDDACEPMTRVGMGVIYTRTHDGLPLRKEPSAAERKVLLDRYYRPHHARLSAAVGEAVDRHGSVLIVDCHSYPSQALPYELNKTGVRPQIGIGTDPFHTPDEVAAAFVTGFAGLGYDVALNTPFAGALVPLERYRQDQRVHSVMIEVRRDLYMDESTGAMLPDYGHVRARLQNMLVF